MSPSSAYFVWGRYGSTTRIALVNFPGYQSSGIILSNDNKHVRYDELEQGDIDKFDSYDCVLAFGMGLKWNDEQRAEIKKLGDKGLPIKVVYATTKENEISSLDAAKDQRISEYLDNGNKKNYRSLSHYIRRYIDGKKWFAPEPDSVAPSSADVYYHLDEDVAFDKLADYEAISRSRASIMRGRRRSSSSGGSTIPSAAISRTSIASSPASTVWGSMSIPSLPSLTASASSRRSHLTSSSTSLTDVSR